MAAPLETFRPLIDACRDLDLSDRESAEAQLRTRFDPEGEAAAELRTRLLDLLDAGEIAHKGELPVKWGRAAKATPDSSDLSIDVVLMNGAGPRHTHPQGEVDYCIPLEGKPTFEGCPRGWVVMPPGSVHVPAVENGTMLIVYLLPQGAIEFLTD
jgi:hypothetical protein